MFASDFTVQKNPTPQSKSNLRSDLGYALVTGASRGLGRCFARTLAAQGRNLVLAARSAEKLEKIAAELRAKDDIQVEIVTIDLAQPGAGQKLAAELASRSLHIDLLVNNAGFGDQGRFLEMPLERQVEMITLQNATVVELTHRLLPAMIEQKNGGVINVSSVAGFQPIPFATVYSAAKAFLTTFSLALEAEMVRHKIPVVTVCPGRLAVAAEDFDPTVTRKKLPGGEQTHELVVAETLRSLERGGGLVIPGAVNKFATFAGRFVPRSKMARLIKNISKPPS